MWEAIAANQRRSWVLISAMGVVLILLGFSIGMLVDPQAGGFFGVVVAVGLWLILWLTAAASGDSILLSSVKAHEIKKEDAPRLWNIVEEMSIASGLARMPRVFIIDDASLNAFAVGHNPDKAAVAVTAGLLKRLSRDELQGVIGHEIGHIRNRDVKFMTLAGVMMGAIVLISQVFVRGMFYGGMGRRRSSSRSGGGQGQAIIMIVALLVAILAPIAAQLLYFACSRRREYLADASSARFTRYPAGLAAALEKISRRPGVVEEANKVVAPMYIINPLQAHGSGGLLSTHPKTEDRVRILRSMGGAGFAAYEEAFRAARSGEHCIGDRTLHDADDVGLRTASADDTPVEEDAVERAQAVGALLDKLIAFTIIPCACGVKLKVPPDFKRDVLTCPRCGRTHNVVAARQAQAAGGKGGPQSPPPVPAEPMQYRRKTHGWETFDCRCGQPVQLSPTFAAKRVQCPKCGSEIEILHD